MITIVKRLPGRLSDQFGFGIGTGGAGRKL